MTSKEALYKLEKNTNWSSDEDIDKDLYNLWGNVACRAIKKDLEVLEILKRKSVDISLIKDIMLDKIKFDYYPYDNLTNEEFNKIKEWLEDE